MTSIGINFSSICYNLTLPSSPTVFILAYCCLLNHTAMAVNDTIPMSYWTKVPMVIFSLIPNIYSPLIDHGYRHLSQRIPYYKFDIMHS